MIVSGKIYTDKGIKYIHEVTMGDNVFDHKGEMTRVTGVAKKFVSPDSVLVREQCVVIRIDGELEDLHVTGDQNILVRSEEQLDYKLAHEIGIGDWVAIPRIRSPGSRGSQINPDMAWFLGLYMMNGVLIDKGETTLVSACFPKEMSESDISKFCESSGQLGAKRVDAKFDQRTDKYWVHMEGDTLIEVVKGLFHRADSNVPCRVPIEFHSWNVDQKTQFLLGALVGCSNRINTLSNQQSWLCHSLEVSFGLYFIASSLGIEINHDIDLWDYQGIISSKKDVNRDEEYIYKQVIFKKNEPFLQESCVYGLETEETGSMCLGACLVHSVLQ